jgi:hypothetical protein
MATIIEAHDTVAPRNSPIIPKVSRGAEAWYTFDTDTSLFYFNRLPGKPNGTIIGSPTATASYGVFKGLSNYINTNVYETQNVTHIAICRSTAVPVNSANGVMFVGNTSANTITPGYTGLSFGVSLFSNSAGVSASGARGTEAGTSGSFTVTDSNDNPTNWAIRAVVINASGNNAYYNLTSGTSVIGNSTGPRTLNGLNFMIGSAVSQYPEATNISAVAIYSVALTLDELNIVAGQMRVRANRLGLSV